MFFFQFYLFESVSNFVEIFADGTKLPLKIACSQDIVHVQSDSNYLTPWA
jgi:hypothetical protein